MRFLFMCSFVNSIICRVSLDCWSRLWKVENARNIILKVGLIKNQLAVITHANTSNGMKIPFFFFFFWKKSGDNVVLVQSTLHTMHAISASMLPILWWQLHISCKYVRMAILFVTKRFSWILTQITLILSKLHPATQPKNPISTNPFSPTFSPKPTFIKSVISAVPALTLWVCSTLLMSSELDKNVWLRKLHLHTFMDTTH